VESLDIHLLVEVARMYYELGKSQEEIAQIKGLSRSKVSRLLEAARAEGIVTIQVHYPLETVSELEAALAETFKLKKVGVAKVLVNDLQAIRQDVFRMAADYLVSAVTSDCRLGVSWGHQMYELSRHLPARSVDRGVSVIQLNGSLTRSSSATQASAIVERFARAFGGTAYLLPVPAIAQRAEAARLFEAEATIAAILDLATRVDIAVFSIGIATRDSILYHSGYFTDDEFDDLLKKGAVGDICARFFDIQGRITDPALDARTIGIRLEQLKQIPVTVGLSAGSYRARAVLGALRGGYVNTLFTDEQTARDVLALHNAGKEG